MIVCFGIVSYIHCYKTVLEKPRIPYKRKCPSSILEKLQYPKVLQSNSTSSMLSLLAESYFAFNKSKLFVVWKITNKDKLSLIVCSNKMDTN